MKFDRLGLCSLQSFLQALGINEQTVYQMAMHEDVLKQECNPNILPVVEVPIHPTKISRYIELE